jgi:hypothetical protein
LAENLTGATVLVGDYQEQVAGDRTGVLDQ